MVSTTNFNRIQPNNGYFLAFHEHGLAEHHAKK